jgi:hypothetical protein
MNVLGVGVVLFVVAAVGYAVTRSGVRVTSHVPIGVVDEVLLGLGLLLLSGLIVLCGGVHARRRGTGCEAHLGRSRPSSRTGSSEAERESRTAS